MIRFNRPHTLSFREAIKFPDYRSRSCAQVFNSLFESLIFFFFYQDLPVVLWLSSLLWPKTPFLHICFYNHVVLRS